MVFDMSELPKMKRRTFLSALSASGLLCFDDLFAEEHHNDSPIGVSIAGAEFGAHQPSFSNQSPGVFGRHYTWNSEKTVQYFCNKGIRVLRVPFRWERIQPKLGDSLDSNELKYLQTFIQWAKTHKGRVILDLHNYGRYRMKHDSKVVEWIVDQTHQGTVPASRDHLADLWCRLSKVFKNEETVYAYGLMNEPHDMGDSDWKAISQYVVRAIRKQDDDKLILVPGDSWSSAPRWIKVHGSSAWVDSKYDPIAYEAHCYFDSDHSGKYKWSYAKELSKDSQLFKRAEMRLTPFLTWCRSNKVQGFLGELGIPSKEKGWHLLLEQALKLLNKSKMGCCYWAAGEWWGNYPLSIQPSQQFQVPASQLSTLLSAK